MLKKNNLIKPQSANFLQCTVQKPDARDFDHMSQMHASGDNKTQKERIFSISKSVPSCKSVSIVETKENQGDLLKEWENLFKQFNPVEKMSTRHGCINVTEDIKKIFDLIPENDPVKKALLTIHTKEYIYFVIEACIKAQTGTLAFGSDKFSDKYYSLGTDVVVQPHTFEVLIRDLATTINLFEQQKSSDCPTLLSLGLPTHHASQAQCGGFCILNKVAILIEYFKQQNIIICGLDINADNGLRDCLQGLIQKSGKNNKFPQSIFHLDLHDSAVWPYQVFRKIKTEKNGKVYRYEPINLKYAPNRNNSDIHPAMQKMINEITIQAKKCGNNLAIYIALGWDSHEDEMAPCGRVTFEDSDLDKKYRQQKRFTDVDFFWFYQQLAVLKKEYQIKFLYIGLEGGYTQKVYQNQCKALIEITCGTKKLNNQLELESVAEESEENECRKRPRPQAIKPSSGTSIIRPYPRKFLDETRQMHVQRSTSTELVQEEQNGRSLKRRKKR